MKSVAEFLTLNYSLILPSGEVAELTEQMTVDRCGVYDDSKCKNECDDLTDARNEVQHELRGSDDQTHADACSDAHTPRREEWS